MKKDNSERIRLLTATGLFAAFIAIATSFIRFPAAFNGYCHVGDSVIYIAAALLPPPYAMLAASIGGAMADLLAGAPEWALATAIIKPLNVVPFAVMRIFLKRHNKDNTILQPQLIAMLIPSGLVTVFGYYAATGIMFGFDASLAVTLATGWIQPTASGAVYLLLGAALDKVDFKTKIYKKKKIAMN